MQVGKPRSNEEQGCAVVEFRYGAIRMLSWCDEMQKLMATSEGAWEQPRLPSLPTLASRLTSDSRKCQVS